VAHRSVSADEMRNGIEFPSAWFRMRHAAVPSFTTGKHMAALLSRYGAARCSHMAFTWRTQYRRWADVPREQHRPCLLELASGSRVRHTYGRPGAESRRGEAAEAGSFSTQFQLLPDQTKINSCISLLAADRKSGSRGELIASLADPGMGQSSTCGGCIGTRIGSLSLRPAWRRPNPG
jgi:hypothetical protein